MHVYYLICYVVDESLKLEEWINPDYFKPEMRVKINKTFARNNSINLHVSKKPRIIFIKLLLTIDL